MLAELAIIPLGRGTHLSTEIAAILEVVDASGLPYQLTPAGTCIEGEWDELMDVVRRCHEKARTMSPHVITTLRIDDEEDGREKLVHNVEAVERKVGHPLRRLERQSPRATAQTSAAAGLTDAPA